VSRPSCLLGATEKWPGAVGVPSSATWPYPDPSAVGGEAVLHWQLPIRTFQEMSLSPGSVRRICEGSRKGRA
jgi:hypothetical protein